MNSKLTCLVLTFIISMAVQDCFATQWAKTYVGDSPQVVRTLMETDDSGFIIAGSVESSSDEGFVMKLDRTGTVAWHKIFEGESTEIDEFYSIQQTTDGGYILAGVTGSFGAKSQDMWLLKLDATGNVIWQKRYGPEYTDSAWAVQQTVDGGYLIAGTTKIQGPGNSFDYSVMKLSQDGGIIWQKSFGSPEDERSRLVQETREGEIIVVGYIKVTEENKDLWILKLDASGTILWQKSFGGPEDDDGDDRALGIHQTNDGGYILTGFTDSFGYADVNMWVLKLASDGSVVWSKIYRSEIDGNSFWDGGISIQPTSDGGYMVFGGTWSPESLRDYWMVKLDSEGAIVWQRTYGGSGQDIGMDVGSVKQTVGGGFVLGGYTESFGNEGLQDVWVLKVDNAGDINNCEIIGSAPVVDVSEVTLDISVQETTVVGQTTSATPKNTSVEPTDVLPTTIVQCFTPDWVPSAPPTQNKLNGVWGYLSSLSVHEFYAVGENGFVTHFDGTNWSTSNTYTSEDLYGVWGSSETDIFAVGDNSTIISYNAEEDWDNVNHNLQIVNLKDIWGSSASDMYTVGEAGFIAHFDGVDWTEVTITPAITETLTGIWGSASNNYVAVGEGGTIVEYGGSSWTEIDPSPTTQDLSEVWGSSETDIYAVGKGGTIVHYNGISWSDLSAIPTAANLRGIWGSSEKNIIAVGEHGTILHYDGTVWSMIDSGSQDSLISTFGTLNPRIMIVGHDGTIFNSGLGPRVQGKICDSCTGQGIDGVQVEFDADPPVTTNAYGIYPPIEDFAGPHTLSFTHADYETASKELTFPGGQYLFDHTTYLVSDTLESYDRCISGTITRGVEVRGKIFDKGVPNMAVKLSEGPSAPQITITDTGGNYYFSGLIGGIYSVEPVVVGSECSTDPPITEGIDVPVGGQTSYDFVYTCPADESIQRPYWDKMTSPVDVVLKDVWTTGESNIFAVGDGETIIRYNGTIWSIQRSGAENSTLQGVWGSSASEVYAVGTGGTILKTTNYGADWTPMTISTTNGLNDVWGSSGTDIYAVGDDGTVYHYDGNIDDIWTDVYAYPQDPEEPKVKLLGVWGSSASDIYVVGNSHKEDYWERTVVHYNGIEWTIMEAGNGVTLMSTSGSGTSDIAAVGAFGSIVRYKEWEVGQEPEWKQSGGPTEKTFNAMWGSSGSNIFAVGFNGIIAHYDGTNWNVREPPPPPDEANPTLHGIWGTASPNIYAVAVGDKGTIYEYKGDLDNDGEVDATDNCVDDQNPDQDDVDGDGHGDVCDNCPNEGNENQANSDYDDYGNACDNCPFDTNEGQEDTGDGDGVGDICDNCPDSVNPFQYDCDYDTLGDVCDPDTIDADSDRVDDVCDNCPTVANDDQADSYPPGGNDCGDACECEGNFNADEDNDVDGSDASTFKTDFGRGGYNRPCIASDLCNGDFECDGDVDGTDASTFKVDFGRGGYNNPCPICTDTNPWCDYTE